MVGDCEMVLTRTFHALQMPPKLRLMDSRRAFAFTISRCSRRGSLGGDVGKRDNRPPLLLMAPVSSKYLQQFVE